jgi:pheromone shutdown protein TraB
MQTLSFTPMALGLDERRYKEVLSKHSQQVQLAEDLRSSYQLLFLKPVELNRLRQWKKQANPREAIS